MIEFNKILNPRLVGWMVRVFAMKIGGSPAPTLAPEVAPSIDVNQQDDPTLPFLRGERLMAAGNFFTASVGNVNKFAIRNPATSGVLLIIEGVTHNAATTLTHGTGVQTADEAGGTVQPQPRDGRWIASGGSRGSAIASWSQTVAPTTPVQYLLPQNAIDVQQCAIIVPPGSAWQCIMAAANTTGSVQVQYRERPIQAEELSTG